MRCVKTLLDVEFAKTAESQPLNAWVPSPATRRRQLKPRSRTRGRQRAAAAAAGARRGETPPSSRRPRRLSRGSIASNDRTSGFAPRANRASAPRSSDTRSFTRISRGFWCWRVGGITASVTTWSGGARSSRSASPPGGRCTLTRGDAAPGRGDRTAARDLWAPLIAALDPADPRRQDLERRLPEARPQ